MIGFKEGRMELSIGCTITGVVTRGLSGFVGVRRRQRQRMIVFYFLIYILTSSFSVLQYK